MDKSAVLTLVGETYNDQDEIKQEISVETTHDVFCTVSDSSQKEFFAAGQKGLKAEYKVTIFDSEYNGEEICILYGKRYVIYRTYHKKNDKIELYLAQEAGA